MRRRKNIAPAGFPHGRGRMPKITAVELFSKPLPTTRQELEAIAKKYGVTVKRVYDTIQKRDPSWGLGRISRPRLTGPELEARKQDLEQVFEKRFEGFMHLKSREFGLNGPEKKELRDLCIYKSVVAMHRWSSQKLNFPGFIINVWHFCLKQIIHNRRNKKKTISMEKVDRKGYEWDITDPVSFKRWQEELRMKKIDSEKIMAAVELLPNNLKGIIISRFGLYGQSPQTSAQLAHKLGITDKTVLNQQKKAFGLMKAILSKYEG